MRALSIFSILGLYVGLITALLVLPFQFELPALRERLLPWTQHQDQAPLMPLPPFLGGGDDNTGGDGRGSDGRPAGDLIISDILNTQRSINIFAGFTRDVDVVSQRIDNKDKNSTILAPLNSEIQKLPRKPWEDPKDYEAMGASAYEGKDGESRAHRNLRRFVEAHVVDMSPWSAGKDGNTLGGGKLRWEDRQGKKVVSGVAASGPWIPRANEVGADSAR
jgi:hypothetical protein